MKKLPIAIQTFSKLRDNDCVYIDKTELIHQLLMGSRTYFFARPRRFGKSMTLSTLKSIYKGEKQYFKGLWIENKWDWTKIHPIVHLKFASMSYDHTDVPTSLMEELDKIAATYGLVLHGNSHAKKFRELLEKLCEAKGKVVILIDEYDKPIIDFLENDELHIAEKNRQDLRKFYSIIKDADEYIEFFFMTGVSRFSHTGIFSHLNHLKDITLDKKFVNLVGYTPTELQENLGEWIDYAHKDFSELSKDEFMEEIKRWYNGYSWDGVNTVYNPYSVLNFLEERSFADYWFKTGTPTFLIKLMQKEQDFIFNDMTASAELLDSYDLENLDLRTILFQTGYLTVKHRDNRNGIYKLDYPNREVEQAMGRYMLAALLHKFKGETGVPVFFIKDAFLQNDVPKVVKLIHAVFKDVPYPLIRNKKEDFYHTVIHIHFRLLGLIMESELMTSDGRMDVAVKTPTHIYIVEFKLDESADIALTQIKEKDYAAKYVLENKQIVLVGINFNSETKGVSEWKMEDFS